MRRGVYDTFMHQTLATPKTTTSAGGRALLLGLTAAAFFAVTFVLNRSMAMADGHWAWSASLRFLIMLPLLALVLTARRQWPALAAAWRSAPRAWLVWGTVGFVIFYTPLTVAATLAPAWVVAGTWPVTIVAGMLLAPAIYSDHRRAIPRRALISSLAIIVGVLLVQLEQAQSADWRSALTGLGLVLVGAVAYPLGNRKMMLHLEPPAYSGPPVDPFVRLTGMTLGSLPAWLLVSLVGYWAVGWPASSQVLQAGIVALSSGIIATALFFAATDLVRREPVALAGVEATQAAEVPFTLLLEALILGAVWPSLLGWTGLAIIVLGIVWYARMAAVRVLGDVSDGQSAPNRQPSAATRIGGIVVTAVLRKAVFAPTIFMAAVLGISGIGQGHRLAADAAVDLRQPFIGVTACCCGGRTQPAQQGQFDGRRYDMRAEVAQHFGAAPKSLDLLIQRQDFFILSCGRGGAIKAVFGGASGCLTERGRSGCALPRARALRAQPTQDGLLVAAAQTKKQPGVVGQHFTQRKIDRGSMFAGTALACLASAVLLHFLQPNR
jgi:drug/metabolite transporter (DMT)-like permease